MLPFNLKSALAGVPLITRSGLPVLKFRKAIGQDCAYPYVIELTKGLYTINKNGRIITATINDEDVFIAELSEVLNTPAPELSILQKAEALINGPRRASYGSASKNFTNVAAGMSVILGVTVTAEQVGLCMVWLKICRQVNKPDTDNLLDAAGYLGCIEQVQKDK